ncbi:MAG: DNA mismatch repair endonuclease MutL [Verrucomicrobiae bacterium]|nr:DNA mismatch repair endonuclease MutL [Verrucomicrobiae bacterium]
MNRIKLLSEQVANQIAAGEVVERPASVVKELVENSLDAGPQKITVEIGAGGRSLIRVTDDGLGMSRDDALLSLERHATSKIRQAEDLASISTMGFRGEALPSIASVSRFTLTTRERDEVSPEGTQILVNGGTIAEVKAAGSAPGTCVEVRQLFYNLPARRKFLRAEETEAAHIQHYLTLAALAFPEVAFTFIKDTRPVWQLPAQKSGVAISSRIEALRERLRALLGDEKLVPVDFVTSFDEPEVVPDESDIFETALPEKPATVRSGLHIWGLIGSPGVSRATRDGQFTYVNRRPVENRGLNYALIEGYHNSLMKGRYPVCCLFLEINPAAVDVNIHPAKREVKFHREFEIRKYTAQAVREALLAFHAEPARINAGPQAPRFEQPEIIPVQDAAGAGAPAAAPALPQFPEVLTPPAEPPALPAQQTPLPMGFAPVRSEAPTSPLPTPVSEPAAPFAGSRPVPPQSPASLPPDRGFGTRPLPSAVPLLDVPLRMVGVIGRLYVVLESDRGLVLLDQHAAHERILFEQMMSRIESNTAAPSQKLLLPETVELPPRDAQFLREQLPALTRLGVGLSEFGERTFLLDALPPFVKAPDSRRFVFDLVDELRAAGREVNLARLGEHTVAKTVCRHAVKAHDPLTNPELENLVDDLRRCAMPYTCPHGRPTLIEMNYRELEKKFGRAA